MYCIYRIENGRKTPVAAPDWCYPVSVLTGRYSSMAEAYAVCPAPKDGVKWRPAFVLPPEGLNGLTCVDFDGPDAALEAEKFFLSLPAGAYLEASQSGTGRHVWLNGDLPLGHDVRRKGLPIEVYSSARGIILGEAIRGVFPPTGDQSAALRQAMQEWGLSPEPKDKVVPALTDKSVDDDAVWAAAYSTHRDLLTGNPLKLAMIAPDSTGKRAYDGSSADFILAGVFWGVGAVDADQVERLMRRTPLYRDKWDNHKTYLTRTIEAAVPVAKEDGDKDNGVNSFQRGGRIKKASEHFAQCVFLTGRGRILTPEGHDLSPSDFDVVYGGAVWALDDRKTTRKASEAFLQSSDFQPRIALGETFRPDRNWLDLTVRGGRTYVNTFRPHKADLVEGDISLFTKLLEANFPDAKDREILVSWCAAAVQEPATRFLWAPVVLGIQGSGKNTITQALRYAIGEDYTHAPKPDPKGGSQFNGYIDKKLLVLPEEAQYTASALEVLKPLITNPWVEVEAKGRDQRMIENYARFFLTGNNLGAIPYDPNERRFAYFVTPFHTATDISAAGLTTDFWGAFWSWAREEQGWAKVAHWLVNYKIKPGFHPVKDFPQAPITSTAAKAHEGGMSDGALLLREAIDSGTRGFNGGFIYGPSARVLLDGAKRVGYALKQLGYHEVPQFKGNAVNRLPKGFSHRGRLYCRDPHLLTGLSAEEVICKFENENQ